MFHLERCGVISLKVSGKDYEGNRIFIMYMKCKGMVTSSRVALCDHVFRRMQDLGMLDQSEWHTKQVMWVDYVNIRNLSG